MAVEDFYQKAAAHCISETSRLRGRYLDGYNAEMRLDYDFPGISDADMYLESENTCFERMTSSCTK